MWNKRGVKTQGSVWAQQGEAKIIIFSSSSKKETCGGGWAGLITFVLTMLSQTKEAQSLSAPWQFDSPQSSSGLGTVHLSVQLGITATSNCGAWNDNMPVKWSFRHTILFPNTSLTGSVSNSHDCTKHPLSLPISTRKGGGASFIKQHCILIFAVGWTCARKSF